MTQKKKKQNFSRGGKLCAISWFKCRINVARPLLERRQSLSIVRQMQIQKHNNKMAPNWGRATSALRMRMRNCSTRNLILPKKRNEYNERFRRTDDRNLRLILFTVVIYARCRACTGPGTPENENDEPHSTELPEIIASHAAATPTGAAAEGTNFELAERWV